MGLGGPGPRLRRPWNGTCVLYYPPGALCGVWSVASPRGPSGTGHRLPTVRTCSPMHLPPLPRPPLLRTPLRVFWGHFPNKPQAFAPRAQHLLPRAPSLHDRAILTSQSKKLPENAEGKREGENGRRGLDGTPLGFLAQLCRSPLRQACQRWGSQLCHDLFHVPCPCFPMWPPISIPTILASARGVQQQAFFPRAAGDRVAATRLAGSCSPSPPGSFLLAAVLLSASPSQAWASPRRC